MKLRKITYTIIGIIFMIIILMTVKVQASDGLKASAQSSKNEVKETEEVVITLKLDEYQNIKNGINTYKATLEYNEDIFEEVLEKDFETKNNWEMLRYNKDTKELISIKKAGSAVPEEVVEVRLKVKERVEPKTTEIKIKDIVSSDGKRDIDVDDTKVAIDVIKEQGEDPDDPEKLEKITSQKYKIEKAYIERIIPNTTVAKFKQNVTLENVTTNPQMVFTDEKGNELQENSFITTGTKLKVGNTLNYTLVVIGDIDKDSKITINDLAKLKLHMLEETLLNGLEIKAADMDDDSQITVNDLAQMKLLLIGLFEIE